MPRIVACGSRQDAYQSFCIALENGNSAMLLVDSEAPVNAECMEGEPESWKPWQHLQSRAGDCWEKPAKASEQECHLMGTVHGSVVFNGSSFVAGVLW